MDDSKIKDFLKNLRNDDLVNAKDSLRDAILDKSTQRIENISKEIENNERTDREA
jgi:hypothetical protein